MLADMSNAVLSKHRLNYLGAISIRQVVDGSAGCPEGCFAMGILVLRVREWSCCTGEGEGSE